jgi:hypothetical protein
VLARLALVVLLAASLKGCVAYEYEHEFWVRVDGSGTVNVTGRPSLWRAFKGLGPIAEADSAALRESARALFERSGLTVRRVTLTRRDGHPYLFVSADFSDLNRLGGTPAFPDLKLGLRREGENLVVEGTWQGPAAADRGGEPEGLMAVRFHLPSKVHSHKNAFAGVERGNITSWRQDVAQGLAGRALDFGVTMDHRSILHSTVALFGMAIAVALAILGSALYLVIRRGRKAPTHP